MQRLEVSGAVRPIYGSLGVKRLIQCCSSRQAIERQDQLVPYYIMDIAATIPSLPGLFVAGVFSAALR